MPKPIRVLAITNLFPNNKEPMKGVFNKQQFLELKKHCEIKVIAPVQWHRCAGIIRNEIIDGIEVHHPCFFTIPGFGRSLNGFFFYFSLICKVKELRKNFKFDLILAFWAYPDGFGSFLLAKSFKKPLIIKAGGSDINYNTQYPLRRRLISYALRNSNKVISVSNALKKHMVEIGVPENKIFVNPNGVNTALFHPMPKDYCREKLKLSLNSKIILFVGNLVPVKGVNYLIDAFAKLDRNGADLKLLIAGSGGLKASLEGQAVKLGIKEKVLFYGKQGHEDISSYINACDVFCLPSINEGCPNVVLEALACGKPVVASRVGGIPDMIPSDKFGVLVEPQDSTALAEGLKKALLIEWDKEFTQKGYSSLSWASSTKSLFEQIETVVANA
jgi:glycosyltransferase involved in cell wall biosynthesis